MIENLDLIISQAETVLSVYMGVLAILLAFVVIGSAIERKRRSPVEKLLRRRFG